MGDSSLLRKELGKIYHEIDLLRKENTELRSQVIQLKEEKASMIDKYESEIEYLVRRLNYYENENAPSSTGSMYNAERKKFQKEEALLDSESADNNAANKDNPSAKNNTNMDLNSRKAGPPKGHEGISHHNRSEYTKRYDVHRCANCGNKHVMVLRPVIRQMYDFDGDRICIVAGTIVVGRCKCDRCGHVTVANSPLVTGTALGPKARGFVVEYFGTRATDETISVYFRDMYDFEISPNAIWNARKAIAIHTLQKTYQNILEWIILALYVHLDETVLKIYGKRGYAWMASIPDATYTLVAASRAGAIPEIHFGALLNKPVIVDGYAGYNSFRIVQRCWVHILRMAEKAAIKAKRGSIPYIQYRRLLCMYRRIKDMDTAPPEYCLSLQRQLCSIADGYGDHAMGTAIHNASPNLFTFLRYKGMPPNNNPVELDIRDTIVLQRNVRHKLMTSTGMHVFSILVSYTRTCQKRGIVPWKGIVELSKNTDWDIFEESAAMSSNVTVAA